MGIFYAGLAYAMTVINLIKALNSMNVMHFAMMAMWLVIGVVFTIKHINEQKRIKNKKKERED